MKRKKRGSDMIAKLNLSLREIEPMTGAQEEFFENYDSGKSQVLIGYPGTGKTFLALFKALEEITTNKDLNRIVIVRSAVPTRDLGFLPGGLDEKGEVYELPYKQVCTDLFGRGDAYEILKKHGLITFLTTSYVRGVTLDHTVVIADEFQNFTAHEADSIVTRLGKGSKILFCGDFFQTDLTKSKDLDVYKFVEVLESMDNWFDETSFEVEDIVRSGIVKAYITSKYMVHREGF